MGNSEGKLVLTDQAVSDIAQSSGLNRSQVESQCKAFLENHPTGQLDRKAFRHFMKLALPKLDMKKMEGHVFRMYDTNSDGVISMEEFLLVFHVLSNGTPEENLQKIFRIFDVNNDGTISQLEMEKLVDDMKVLLGDEGTEVNSKEMLAKSTFTEMDKNGDGKVTSAEFTQAILGDDKFSRLLAVSVMQMFV